MAYINGVGSISTQSSFSNLIRNPPKNCIFNAIEPDYSKWMDPMSLRRMSRILCMGIASAKMALAEAEVELPDAIITGTGYGCLEDTTSFLKNIIEDEEGMLNPTPFIRSTHNTIGSQIAIILSCHGYNLTYSHQSFSFESALLDTLMLFEEGEYENILVGGVDEITKDSHLLMQKYGLFSDDLIHGEGGFYFTLGNSPSNRTSAQVSACEMFYNHQHADLQDLIKNFLYKKGMQISNIDVLLYGGTKQASCIKLNEFIHSLFTNTEIINYKDYSGEFPTSSAFAMVLGTDMIREAISNGIEQPPTNILIYNPSFGNHHSLILLKR